MGLFRKSKPVCPISDEMQTWVDGRIGWLHSTLGDRVSLAAPVICPTSAFFPDPYAGTGPDAYAMYRRVAGYMKVDPDSLWIQIFSAGPEIVHRPHGAAGLYNNHGTDSDSRPQILVEASQLGDPMSLVATLAHEIGHEILLGRKLVDRAAQDHEPLTDLLTVFYGMGIFSANATIYDSGWSRNGWHGWKTGRRGYLDQPTYGYALARFAQLRGETAPSWMKHLRPDVRKPMKQSLEFLAG